MKKTFLILSSLFLISSCSILNQMKSGSELDYLEKGAQFDIKNFFDGNVEGFAIVQDGNGKIIDTKTITISGDWDENKGTIKQKFTTADGKKDSRTWLITLEDDGKNFSAIGHDIVSPVQGKQAGNAMQMLYSLSLSGSVKGQKTTVNFDDKLYLVDKNSAIMISTAKAGFAGDVKKVIISFKKLSAKDKE